MASTDALSLPDLAELTGLSPRTIRSLISQDLLQGPTTRGRYATYGAYHVERLRAIRYLREAEGLTVPETAAQLERLAAGEVRELAARWERGVREASGVPVAPASRSALEYLRSIGAAAGPAEAVGGKPRPTVFPRPREAVTKPQAGHREALRPVERLCRQSARRSARRGCRARCGARAGSGSRSRPTSSCTCGAMRIRRSSPRSSGLQSCCGRYC